MHSGEIEEKTAALSMDLGEIESFKQNKEVSYGYNTSSLLVTADLVLQKYLTHFTDKKSIKCSNIF